MNLVLDRERFGDALIAEMQPLIELHHSEISHFKDLELDPSFDSYKALEEAGILRFFTVRDDDKFGELVGYSVWTVTAHPHFKGIKQATEDLLLLHPDCRKGREGVRFIGFCDGWLKGDGIKIIYHSVNMAHDFSAILKRMGYVAVDTVYARRV